MFCFSNQCRHCKNCFALYLSNKIKILHYLIFKQSKEEPFFCQPLTCQRLKKSKTQHATSLLKQLHRLPIQTHMDYKLATLVSALFLKLRKERATAPTYVFQIHNCPSKPPLCFSFCFLFSFLKQRKYNSAFDISRQRHLNCGKHLSAWA